MGMTVWVDAWQMQCCGEPFRRGSRVSWTLGTVDSERIHALLGAHGQHVDAEEHHHGGVPEDTEPTQGTVTRITAVFFRDGPGGGSLRDVNLADGWTGDRDDERFVGYLAMPRG
jgi:hypothetical protein